MRLRRVQRRDVRHDPRRPPGPGVRVLLRAVQHFRPVRPGPLPAPDGDGLDLPLRGPGLPGPDPPGGAGGDFRRQPRPLGDGPGSGGVLHRHTLPSLYLGPCPDGAGESLHPGQPGAGGGHPDGRAGLWRDPGAADSPGDSLRPGGRDHFEVNHGKEKGRENQCNAHSGPEKGPLYPPFL